MKAILFAVVSVALMGQATIPVIHAKKNVTTADQTASATKSAEQWDQEMAQTLQALNKALAKNPSALSALAKSQEAWVVTKNEDFRLIDAIYAKKTGTMYGPMRISDRTEIVKSRAQNLKSLLSIAKLP
jgi:uncharacterized protein YecT (DUF1311 family)